MRTLIISAMLLILAGTAYADDFGSAVNGLCGTVRASIGAIFLFLIILSGAIYGVGQALGAESRARATVWATNMFLATLVGSMLIFAGPMAVNAFMPIDQQVCQVQSETGTGGADDAGLADCQKTCTDANKRCVLNSKSGRYGCESIAAVGCSPECKTGESCISGRCVQVEGCAGGCPAGTTCVGTRCIAIDPCRNKACGIGYTCVNGVCVKAGCANDLECDEYEICKDSQCISGCRSAGECLTPCFNGVNTCVNNVCGCGECATDADCGKGRCVDSKCVAKKGCASDADCTDPTKKKCDTATGNCVQCLVLSDCCPGPAYAVCNYKKCTANVCTAK
ncbi:MAG: hypothetical protein ACP5NX_01830 [Candidatus Bilamarchaeaceae archaeon]